MKTMLTLAALLMAPAANASAQLPTTDAKALALVSEDLDWPMRVNVNGLPMGRMDHKSYPKNFKGATYVLIPDLLLTKGKNVLTVTWKKNEDIDLQYYKGNEIRFVELDSVEPQKIGKVLGTFRRSPDDVTAKKALVDELTFEVTGDLPAWKWTTSPVIPAGAETQKKLVATASSIATQWGGFLYSEAKAKKPKTPVVLEKALADQETSAKRAGLKQDPHAAMLGALIAKKKVRKHPVALEFRDDSARLQILAGGRMARLVFVYGDDEPEDWDALQVFPWSFVGGAHDADPGPIDESFDIWFRLEGDAFVPSAVFHQGPDTEI